MADLIQLAVIFLTLALVFFMLGLRERGGFTMNTARWPVMIFIAGAIILLVL
jgi:hypothetical protein